MGTSQLAESSLRRDFAYSVHLPALGHIDPAPNGKVPLQGPSEEGAVKSGGANREGDLVLLTANPGFV